VRDGSGRVMGRFEHGMIVGVNVEKAGVWIVHRRPMHAVMAVHTVYQSNAYRIDFNTCVRRRKKRMGREKKREEWRENEAGGSASRRFVVKAPVADALSARFTRAKNRIDSFSIGLLVKSLDKNATPFVSCSLVISFPRIRDRPLWN